MAHSNVHNAQVFAAGSAECQSYGSLHCIWCAIKRGLSCRYCRYTGLNYPSLLRPMNQLHGHNSEDPSAIGNTAGAHNHIWHGNAATSRLLFFAFSGLSASIGATSSRANARMSSLKAWKSTNLYSSVGSAPRVVGTDQDWLQMTDSSHKSQAVPSFKETQRRLLSQGILPGIGAVCSCADCDPVCHSLSRIQFSRRKRSWNARTTTSNGKVREELKVMLSKLWKQECAHTIHPIPWSRLAAKLLKKNLQ